MHPDSQPEWDGDERGDVLAAGDTHGLVDALAGSYAEREPGADALCERHAVRRLHAVRHGDGDAKSFAGRIWLVHILAHAVAHPDPILDWNGLDERY